MKHVCASGIIQYLYRAPHDLSLGLRLAEQRESCRVACLLVVGFLGSVWDAYPGKMERERR